jgi:integrase/recombinase XerD
VPQEPLVRTMLLTGARYGEVRRVAWADLDVQRRVLRLRSEVTKSRRERLIPLTDDLVGRLQRLRAVQQVALGCMPTIADLIFLAPQGTPLCRPSNNVNRLFARLLDRARIPKVDETGRAVVLHGLRMTCASRLVRSGASLPVAQKLLGHASPVTTAACYVEVDAEDLRAAVESLPEVGAARPTAAREAR